MAKSIGMEKYDERDYEKEYKIPKSVTSRSTQVDHSNIIGLSIFSNKHTVRTARYGTPNEKKSQPFIRNPFIRGSISLAVYTVFGSLNIFRTTGK